MKLQRRRVGAHVVLGIGPPDHPVRPLEDPVAVVDRHAEQLGDRDERQLGSNCRHEVDAAFSDRRVDDACGDVGRDAAPTTKLRTAIAIQRSAMLHVPLSSADGSSLLRCTGPVEQLVQPRPDPRERVRRSRELEVDEPVRLPRVADLVNVDAALAESGRVGAALVAQQVGATEDHESRREPGE
jgi:hypothetical protein